VSLKYCSHNQVYPVLPKCRVYLHSWAGRPSIDQLQGELNLPGVSRSLAYHSKAAASHDIGRQAKVHYVENVEELSPELQNAQLTVTPVAKRCVFNDGEVIILEPWATEGVTA
jgi:hypothetical protein